MQEVIVTLTPGVLERLDNLYKQRNNIDEDHDTDKKKAEFIGKALSYELQELAKQYDREIALAQINEAIKTSDDYVETDFEKEIKDKPVFAQDLPEESVTS